MREFNLEAGILWNTRFVKSVNELAGGLESGWLQQATFKHEKNKINKTHVKYVSTNKYTKIILNML